MSANFTDYYINYFNQIKKDETVLEYKREFDDCLDVIVSETGNASESIRELQGDYSKELMNGLTGIVNESDNIYKIMNIYLKKTIKEINELSDYLEKFKNDDEELELKQKTIKQENDYKSMEIDTLDHESEEYRKLYSDWTIRMEKINKEVQTLSEKVKDDKKVCDDKIKIIEKFNDDLVNIKTNNGFIQAL